jgi:hypothetical protein
MRVLTPEWTDDLHQATTDLAVRAFELDLAAVTKNDVPIAAEVLTRARYFTAVLDERPASGLPPPLVDADAGASDKAAAESDDERLQRVPHNARVGIWDLRTERLLTRIRAWAGGDFVPVGDRVVQSARARAAQQRQVNNCSLALTVKEAIDKRTKPPPETGAAPSATPAP